MTPCYVWPLSLSICLLFKIPAGYADPHFVSVEWTVRRNISEWQDWKYLLFPKEVEMPVRPFLLSCSEISKCLAILLSSCVSMSKRYFEKFRSMIIGYIKSLALFLETILINTYALAHTHLIANLVIELSHFLHLYILWPINCLDAGVLQSAKTMKIKCYY